jgi:hypothetical protein
MYVVLCNFVAMIPLACKGTPIECAKVIAFLASDAASYVVGQTIKVNGGELMLYNSELADPFDYRCGTRVALPTRPAEARSDLGCGGRKTGRAKHEPLEAFDEISPR